MFQEEKKKVRKKRRMEKRKEKWKEGREGRKRGKEECRRDWLEKSLVSRTQNPYYSREVK